MPSLRDRSRNYREHLRFKWAPKIANWLVARSTDRARFTLSRQGPIKVLLDNTVFYHAVTHETTWVSTGTRKWGTHEFESGYAARVCVHPADSESREYRCIRYLAGLAHLCRQGLIQLFTSAELQDEQFRQPSGRYRGYGYFDFSLFGGLPIKSVDGHVFPNMGPAQWNLPSAEEQQRTRLAERASDPTYAALLRRLGPKNSQDAWHLYTAEKHKMFCFLTMDFKFINAVRAQSKGEPLKSFRSLVLTPEELGKRLGLFPVPPHLLSYNDASWFVRSDIARPRGRRRPLKGYKVER